MATKIVRLTESDLIRLVKKVIREEEDYSNLYDDEKLDLDKFDKYMDSKGPGTPSTKQPKKGPFATHKNVGGWMDADDTEVSEPTDYSEEREFGPDEYDDFMEFINNCDNKWCLKTKEFYDRYADKGNIKVRK
jgi:hypothetical protein